MGGEGEPSTADTPAPLLELSEIEGQVLEQLRRLGKSPASEEELANTLKLGQDAVRGSLQRLKSKHLAVVDESHRSEVRLSRRGEQALAAGLPERRLLEAIRSARGVLDPPSAAKLGLSPEEQAAAVGQLRRAAILEDGIPFRLATASPPPKELASETALNRATRGELSEKDEQARPLLRRGLLEVIRTTARAWSASEEGRSSSLAVSDRPGLGPLTAEVLRQGSWREARFRPYDVRATVPLIDLPRPHPYAEWLAEFSDLLVGLGFSEAEGPLLETEFWNSDVLFMPQDHPGRSIHDALSVEGVSGRLPAADLLSRVRAAHEGRPLPGETEPISVGWRYPFSEKITARPILRSQTTAVSARFLATGPKPPFRVFTLDRNFRRESLDSSHHIEFTQCEGILGEEGADVRHLVGLFRELAEGIGVKELKIRPSYFPFTEPSIEAYVRHPVLGWMEVFPGGVFRPEVTRPLGVDVPVLAWGIGVMRLAMVALGVSDIRLLFDDNLANLQTRGG